MPGYSHGSVKHRSPPHPQCPDPLYRLISSLKQTGSCCDLDPDLHSELKPKPCSERIHFWVKNDSNAHDFHSLFDTQIRSGAPQRTQSGSCAHRRDYHALTIISDASFYSTSLRFRSSRGVFFSFWRVYWRTAASGDIFNCK